MSGPSASAGVSRRREPVQERSRQTVNRILDAAASLIEESGVDAVTTRSTADRAAVSYPSLYRFFRDRDEILDQLLERHIAEIEALTAALEPTWDIQSAADLLNAQFALHVDFYREHPSAAELWMGGRASAAVADRVHARIRRIADGMHAHLVRAGLVPRDTNPRALLVIVEMGDRALELAYRATAEFDPELLELGRQLLVACMQRLEERQD